MFGFFNFFLFGFFCVVVFGVFWVFDFFSFVFVLKEGCWGEMLAACVHRKGNIADYLFIP